MGDAKLAEESRFVEIAQAAADEVLRPPLCVKRGAALLYQVTVDNNLELTVDPQKPMRGDSAFQTDLCIFEAKASGSMIPRVVLEFKTRVSTHDIITYSVKARRHKQVYPYLRYGLVVSEESFVPGRFFVHNESLDFFLAMKTIGEVSLSLFLKEILSAEVRASELLEKIAFGSHRPTLFRTKPETAD